MTNLSSPFLSSEQREIDRKAKRDAVLLAAVKIFNERGFHATSLDDVANSLGISKPTIYHYLGNKEQVLLTCVQVGLEQMLDATQQASQSSKSGIERLKDFLFAYGCHTLNDFGRCVVFTNAHSLSPEALKEFKALKRQVNDLLISILEDGIKDGSISDQQDKSLISSTMFGALNWSVHWYSEEKADKEKTVMGMVNILLDGVKA